MLLRMSRLSSWALSPLMLLFASAWLMAVDGVSGADPKAASPAAVPVDGDVRLTLPPQAFAVVGEEMGIYLDNLVLAEDPSSLQYEVECAVGSVKDRVWKLTAKPEEVGSHSWKVRVRNGDKVLGEQSLTLKVINNRAGEGRSLRLLIVGDSLTHASLTANDLSKRLAAEGQPKTTFLGTHHPKSAAEGVAHEGYGGWTWRSFTSRFVAMPEKEKLNISSPFVFAEGEGSRLDVPRYIQESCGGVPPDLVIFKLGINDCFGAPANDPEKMDQHIDGVFKEAEVLLAAFRKAAPQADLGVCLTTPGNTRDAAFEANYKGRYSRWNWRKIQHRLVQRQLQQFSSREADRIFLVPTELNLDTTAGYPDNNAVHPNAMGYQQIAATMHAWILSRFSQETR